MKRKVLLSVCSVFLFLSIFVCINTSIKATATYQIDENMGKIMNDIAEYLNNIVLSPDGNEVGDSNGINGEQNKEYFFSSNPYDYIEGNESFDNIVKLGIEALEPIRKKIDESDENGLKEYILAIAGERIAKVDLKKDSFNWTNGKAWVKEWEKHLLNIPDNVSRIIDSTKTDEVKFEALKKLGMPAVPFIIDEIEKGNNKYIKVVSSILGENKKLDKSQMSELDYKDELIRKKGNYELLRQLVNKEVNKYE